MGLTLQARGVRIQRQDRVLLDDVTLSAAGGQVLVIIGPSGGGKTTLLRVLHGLVHPDEGSVVLTDPEGSRRVVVDPGRTHGDWNRSVAWVQQRPGLLSTRTLDDVTFTLRARGARKVVARERARQWLSRLDLQHVATAPTRQLSGGEAQRVAVVRALALQTPVLLLDECTNQLDPEQTARVEALVRDRAAAGAAVVMVTHSISQAHRMADRFVHMAKGCVVEEGDRERLRAPAQAETRAFLRHV